MNPPIPIPRPAKRIRAADEAGSVLPLLGTSLPPSSLQVPLKRERSPSPPFERRLVTSGTRRFAPLPTNCLPSCPEYRHNRAHWAAQHVKELEALNLILERKMIRDDGLIIDWKSLVPVWSDSLKPEVLDLAATITLAHQTNTQRPLPRVRRESPSKSVTGTPTSKRSTPTVLDSGNLCDSDTGPPTRKNLPVPPGPSLMRRMILAPPITPSAVDSRSSGYRSSSPSSKTQRSPDDIEVANTSHPPPCRQTPDSASRPPGMADFVSTQHAPDSSTVHESYGQAGDQLISRGFSAAEEEMSEMTLDFLRRYVQTYESDRASLGSAYARNASFAYRVHKIGYGLNGSLLSIQQTSSCSAPKRNRLDIITALLTLPPLHPTPPARSAVAQIHYDIFYLGEGLGMFVVCRGVISGKTVVHNLILQKKEADVEDAAVEGVWPLVVAAHQILVFES